MDVDFLRKPLRVLLFLHTGIRSPHLLESLPPFIIYFYAGFLSFIYIYFFVFAFWDRNQKEVNTSSSVFALAILLWAVPQLGSSELKKMYKKTNKQNLHDNLIIMYK